MVRTMVALLLAVVMAACGGAHDAASGAEGFAARMQAAAGPLPTTPAAVAVVPTTVSADMTLDWAEYRFPDLFPKAVAQRFPAITYAGATYNARAYAGSWGMRYLGIRPDGRIYGLGDFTQNQLQAFETIAHWAAQVLADWCQVKPADCSTATASYEPGAVAPSTAPAISSGVVSSTGSGTSAALTDGTRITVPGLAAPYELELQRLSVDAATLQTVMPPGLVATGAVRQVTIAGSLDPSTLRPVITIPASEAGQVNPNTLNVLRVGDAMVNGQLVQNHRLSLPVTRNAQGQLQFVDPVMRDGLRLVAMSASSPPDARTLAARSAVSTARHEWVGSVYYVLTSFQDELNWTRQPELVRMVPDATRAASGWRRPATTAERAQLAKTPICNLLLLVHGHNEEERSGSGQATETTPWLHSYKRRVWDLLYQEALAQQTNGQAKYPQGCTAFYEFVYPTYRPIFSPVPGPGGLLHETLGEALGRTVREEAARDLQLKAMLDGDMPFNAIVVGHSQGGLVARAGFRFMPDSFKANIRRFVSWGSPHHGAAAYSMRYAMLAGHDLVIDGMRLPLQSVVQGTIAGKALDTPGIRDLRWEARHKDKVNLRTMMPSLTAAAEAAIEPGLYSDNLSTFNTAIDVRELDAGPLYTLFTGTKLKSAEIEMADSNASWWFQYRNQQAVRFLLGSTETEQGAALNKLLMVTGYGSSDGAAALYSQRAQGVSPQLTTLDLGDIDHEEFYGAEPPHRNAASMAKGTLTAARTFEVGRLQAADNSCPFIEALTATAQGSTVSLSGRLKLPLYSRLGKAIGPRIARIEARAGGQAGAVVGGLSFAHDNAGGFTGSGPAAAVPAGPVAVVVVLKDGSEVAASVSVAAGSDFIRAVVAGLGWTITENREGSLRATLSRVYESRFADPARYDCSLIVNWALPTDPQQPLVVSVTRALRIDGQASNDSFSIRYVSYYGRVMQRADGVFVARSGSQLDPSATYARTDQGIRREISVLPPEQVTSNLPRRPTLYLEIDGLCGGSDRTEIRFDYEYPF